MKVLYLSYDGMTDPLGQSQVLPYLKLLSKKGYQFTIISFEKKARYEKEEKTIKAIVSEANIEWVPLFFTAKPPVLSKIYDRWHMWHAASSLQNKEHFDLIHCRSYVAAEVGLRLKHKFGVKMLFDMRGFWADEKVDNGQWDLKNPLFKNIYKHYKQKEKEFLLQADGIVSLTSAAKDYIHHQKGFENLSIEVIPCCADLAHFNFGAVDNAKTKELQKRLGIKDDEKIITYLGSVGGWYMTKEMFRFFYLLLRKFPHYKMLLLTKDDEASVRKEAQQAGIPDDKVIVTYSTRAELPNYLSLCTSSIFFIRNTFSKTASSPTKHAELMGMGMPVICNEIGDTGNIIKATQSGLLVNTFDEETLMAAVNRLPELEMIDKGQIRQCAKDIFDLNAGAEKYAGLYKKILSPKTGATVS